MKNGSFSEEYLSHHGVKGMKWGVRRKISRDGHRVARSQSLLESNHRSERSRQKHIKRIQGIYKKYENASKDEKKALENSRNSGLRNQMVLYNRGYTTGRISGDNYTKAFLDFQLKHPTSHPIADLKRNLAIGIGAVTVSAAYHAAKSKGLIGKYSSYRL